MSKVNLGKGIRKNQKTWEDFFLHIIFFLGYFIVDKYRILMKSVDLEHRMS